jgi:hypothetical protein
VVPPLAALHANSSIAFTVTVDFGRGLVSHVLAACVPVPGAPGAAPPAPSRLAATDDFGVVALVQHGSVHGLTSGTYDLVVQAVDVAGRAGPPHTSRFTVDVTPPVSAFGAALPPYTASSTLTVVARVVEAHSLTGSRVRVRVDGAPRWDAVPPVTLGPAGLNPSALPFPFAGLAEGAHTFEVTAVDGAGNAQVGPLAQAHTVVDTLSPVVRLHGGGGPWVPLPRFTRNPEEPLCVSLVADAGTPVVLYVAVGGAPARPLPAANASDGWACAVLFQDRTPVEGNLTVVATAVDAAGNAAVPDSTWLVYDATPPGLTLALLPVPASSCVWNARRAVLVCDSPAALVYDLACSAVGDDASSTTTVVAVDAVAPCVAQWTVRVTVAAQPEACGALDGDEPPPGAWTNVTAPGPVALGPVVTAQLAGDALVRLLSRAVDAAGNMQPATVTLVYVDVRAPAAPVVGPNPPPVTLPSRSVLVLSVRDESPGQLGFAYNLTSAAAGGGQVALPGPRPAVSEAAGTAGDPFQWSAELVLNSLPPNDTYTLRAWTVDQAGRVSGAPGVRVWHVLPSMPWVNVVAAPAAESGTWQPAIRVAVAWGDGVAVPDGAPAAVTFEFQVRACARALHFPREA